MSLGDIVDVGGRCDDCVHQTGLRVHPNMGLHAQVRLVTLHQFVYFDVVCTALVLCRARCNNQGGIHHGARFKQQAMGGQSGIDDLENLRT